MWRQKLSEAGSLIFSVVVVITRTTPARAAGCRVWFLSVPFPHGLGKMRFACTLNNPLASASSRQTGGGNELLSACASGTLRLWDVRMTHNTPTVQSRAQRSAMTCMAVHERVSVMATGSHDQFINVRMIQPSKKIQKIVPVVETSIRVA